MSKSRIFLYPHITKLFPKENMKYPFRLYETLWTEAEYLLFIHSFIYINFINVLSLSTTYISWNFVYFKQLNNILPYLHLMRYLIIWDKIKNYHLCLKVPIFASSYDIAIKSRCWNTFYIYCIIRTICNRNENSLLQPIRSNLLKITHNSI